MKKLIGLILFATLSLTSMAQDLVVRGDSVYFPNGTSMSKSEYDSIAKQINEVFHMSFLGISFTTPVDKFVEQLKEKGYEPMEYDDPTFKCFKGMFYGERANVYLKFDPASKMVYVASAYLRLSSRKYMKDIMDSLVEDVKDKYKTEGESDFDEKTGLRNYRFQIGLNSIIVGEAELEVMGEISYNVFINYNDIINMNEVSNARKRDV